MAFGLVLIVALLAAHTATAARTIDAGVQSNVTCTGSYNRLPGGDICLLPGRLGLGRQPYLPRSQLSTYCSTASRYFCKLELSSRPTQFTPKCS